MDNLLHKLTTLCNLLSSLEKRVETHMTKTECNHIHVILLPFCLYNDVMIAILCPFQVLKALQEAVTNHNLSLQPSTPPESVTAPKKQARPNTVHSFQVTHNCLLFCSLVIRKCLHLFMCMCLLVKVKVVRYGRQTVSVDIDAGVLLFDKKTGSFGMETVTHDRSEFILPRNLRHFSLHYYHTRLLNGIYCFYVLVVQLVKIQRTPAKLKIVIDSYHNPPRELVFESMKVR